MDHVKFIWPSEFAALTESHSYADFKTNCSILPVFQMSKKVFLTAINHNSIFFCPLDY